MGVPLIVKAPGLTTPGATTTALSTSVDVATTICALAGIDVARTPSLHGADLSPVLRAPETSVRDAIYLAQDSAQSELLRMSRYAVRGFFDGTNKVARYYGVGGGIDRQGRPAPEGKVFGPDAAFEDEDHEWYDHGEDPDELVNLAQDRSRRAAHREQYERLLEVEAAALG